MFSDSDLYRFHKATRAKQTKGSYVSESLNRAARIESTFANIAVV